MGTLKIKLKLEIAWGSLWEPPPPPPLSFIIKLKSNLIQVRAQTSIRAGQEILTQYIAGDKPTHVRRNILWYEKFCM